MIIALCRSWAYHKKKKKKPLCMAFILASPLMSSTVLWRGISVSSCVWVLILIISVLFEEVEGCHLASAFLELCTILYSKKDITVTSY